jgi:predicted amidohydrolase YtcJ
MARAHTEPLAGMSLLALFISPSLTPRLPERFPSERLTRAEALKGMTLDAAYASFAEERLGSLVPGKKADYVVFDRDFVTEDAPPEDILRARVHATVVDGRVAYGGL